MRDGGRNRDTKQTKQADSSNGKGNRIPTIGIDQQQTADGKKSQNKTKPPSHQKPLKVEKFRSMTEADYSRREPTATCSLSQFDERAIKRKQMKKRETWVSLLSCKALLSIYPSLGLLFLNIRCSRRTNASTRY